MKRFIAALSALVGLSSCTGTVDVFPMNIPAKQMGSPKISFERNGTGSGPVTIMMPDGEVLKGRYRVAFGGGYGMAFSGTQSATALVITDGPVQFVARGPKTELLCRGRNSIGGHGNGECQTFDGAVWAISW